MMVWLKSLAICEDTNRFEQFIINKHENFRLVDEQVINKWQKEEWTTVGLQSVSQSHVRWYNKFSKISTFLEIINLFFLSTLIFWKWRMYYSERSYENSPTVLLVSRFQLQKRKIKKLPDIFRITILFQKASKTFTRWRFNAFFQGFPLWIRIAP